MKRILRTLAIGLLVGPMTAHGAAIFSFQELGADVLFSLSGSLNLSGSLSVSSLTCSNASEIGVVYPARGGTEVGGTGPCDLYFFPTAGAVSFGGDFRIFEGYVGDRLWVLSDIGRLAVDAGYVFGTALTGSATLLGQSFASLGITPGEYVWELPEDRVVFRIGPTGVPEPATLALFGLGLAGVAASVARRRRQA